MTNIKAVYDSYVEKLVKCLPMDDAYFIAKLSTQQLLPGDTESKIKALATQADKASYFLNHVIKPALSIDDTSEFNKLLCIMQECGYNHVKSLSYKIQYEFGDRSKQEFGMYMHIYVATHVYATQIIMHAIYITCKQCMNVCICAYVHTYLYTYISAYVYM